MFAGKQWMPVVIATTYELSKRCIMKPFLCVSYFLEGMAWYNWNLSLGFSYFLEGIAWYRGAFPYAFHTFLKGVAWYRRSLSLGFPILSGRCSLV
jgi:hypothetical protein